MDWVKRCKKATNQDIPNLVYQTGYGNSTDPPLESTCWVDIGRHQRWLRYDGPSSRAGEVVAAQKLHVIPAQREALKQMLTSEVVKHLQKADDKYT